MKSVSGCFCFNFVQIYYSFRYIVCHISLVFQPLLFYIYFCCQSILHTDLMQINDDDLLFEIHCHHLMTKQNHFRLFNADM